MLLLGGGVLFLQSNADAVAREKQVQNEQMQKQILQDVCSDEDAIQMFIQTPDSTHPKVLNLTHKLKTLSKLNDSYIYLDGEKIERFCREYGGNENVWSDSVSGS